MTDTSLDLGPWDDDSLEFLAGHGDPAPTRNPIVIDAGTATITCRGALISDVIDAIEALVCPTRETAAALIEAVMVTDDPAPDGLADRTAEAAHLAEADARPEPFDPGDLP